MLVGGERLPAHRQRRLLVHRPRYSLYLLYSYKSTCFTSTKVQVLSVEALRELAGEEGQGPCFTSTKVQILTAEVPGPSEAAGEEGQGPAPEVLPSNSSSSSAFAAGARVMALTGVSICTFEPVKQVQQYKS